MYLLTTFNSLDRKSQRQAIIWSNDHLIHWRICASTSSESYSRHPIVSSRLSIDRFRCFLWLPLCWFLHDDIIKWKHFPRYWPFVRGIHWSPVNSPHKGQWRGALMFCLNTRLSKQWWGWWFETPPRPLWRHSNEECAPEDWYCSSLSFTPFSHYNDVMMSVMASQITSLTIVYSIVYSGED